MKNVQTKTSASRINSIMNARFAARLPKLNSHERAALLFRLKSMADPAGLRTVCAA